MSIKPESASVAAMKLYERYGRSSCQLLASAIDRLAWLETGESRPPVLHEAVQAVDSSALSATRQQQPLGEADDGDEDRDAQTLAQLYAGILNALALAGSEDAVDAEELSDELADSGWMLTRHPSGLWVATPTQEDYGEDDDEELTEARQEGEVWQGKSGRWFTVKKGRTVPTRNPQAQSKQGARERAKAAHASGRQVDRQALAQKLAAFAPEGGANIYRRQRAGAAARMLSRHHGEAALHRVEELAGALETALGKVQGDGRENERKRDLLKGKLTQLGLALEALGQGRPAAEPKAEEKPAEKPAERGSLITDPARLNRDNLRVSWEAMRDELAAHDPKLSPNRAGELAAARLRHQIGNRLADIELRARSGDITPEEERFYDDINVNGWAYGRDLEMMSGNRTMAADMDDPYVQRPLDAAVLDDRTTPRRQQADDLRRQADEVDSRRAADAKAKAERNRVERERFERQQQETTAREMARARVWRDLYAGRHVADDRLADAGFTGTDAQGREWRNGELVAKPEEKPKGGSKAGVASYDPPQVQYSEPPRIDSPPPLADALSATVERAAPFLSAGARRTLADPAATLADKLRVLGPDIDVSIMDPIIRAYNGARPDGAAWLGHNEMFRSLAGAVAAYEASGKRPLDRRALADRLDSVAKRMWQTGHQQIAAAADAGVEVPTSSGAPLDLRAASALYRDVGLPLVAAVRKELAGDLAAPQQQPSGPDYQVAAPKAGARVKVKDLARIDLLDLDSGQLRGLADDLGLGLPANASREAMLDALETAQKGGGTPAPAGPTAPQPDAGFTGTDAQGREWRNGELVAKGEEKPAEQPKAKATPSPAAPVAGVVSSGHPGIDAALAAAPDPVARARAIYDQSRSWADLQLAGLSPNAVQQAASAMEDALKAAGPAGAIKIAAAMGIAGAKNAGQARQAAIEQLTNRVGGALRASLGTEKRPGESMDALRARVKADALARVGATPSQPAAPADSMRPTGQTHPIDDEDIYHDGASKSGGVAGIDSGSAGGVAGEVPGGGTIGADGGSAVSGGEDGAHASSGKKPGPRRGQDRERDSNNRVIATERPSFAQYATKRSGGQALRPSQMERLKKEYEEKYGPETVTTASNSGQESGSKSLDSGGEGGNNSSGVGKPPEEPKMTQEPKPADMALPVHMTRLADFLAEPHGPLPEPEKVAVKAAPARMGGGHIVTIHHGGAFTEHHLLPRQAATESAAREQALTRWRKSQEPAALHRAAVANAMKERRRVPDEVAADYPDLVDKYGTSAALPDRRMGRVPGSSLLLRYTAKQPPGVRRKSKGKFVLDVGPDPRTAYRDGEVIDIDGTPHIITAAAATARKFSPEDSDGGRVWSGNVQDVSARPLTPQEAAVYARLVSNV